MADAAVEPGALNPTLSSEEKRIYGQLFRQADTENVGVVTGDLAVKFFEKTRLDSATLGKIWQVADAENRGFLTPAGFGMSLRLIGHAQAGREPTAELALQQGPIPRFDGFAPAPGSPAGLQAQATGSGPIRIPPLTAEKVAQYGSLFEKQPIQNGMLPGEQAKQIFERSGLPTDVLSRIWMLADTEQRGALVQTEFVMAMHLLKSMKQGTLRGLPILLPAGLFEAATRRGPAGQPRSPTAATAPLLAMPRQLSGQPPLTRMASPLGRSPPAPSSAGDWPITADDKTKFDQIYHELDKEHKGFITGEEAVPFFKQANLPEDTLAQVWDLADIKSEGRLTKDEFAVAMYFIRQQRSNRDGSCPLPTALPPNLVPPSMRSRTGDDLDASAFDGLPVRTPPPQKPASALDDLFGLDDAVAPPAPPQMAVRTGGSHHMDPFVTSAKPALAINRPPASGASTTTFKPFVPSSSFGRGLAVHSTGTSTGSTSPLPRPVPLSAAAGDDLLGGSDEPAKALDSSSTELANLSNQIGSLSKQMQNLQDKRTATQNELSQTAMQKNNFEQRLAQLRIMYDKEAELVRSLDTQLGQAKKEVQKLQGDMMAVSGACQDLLTQRRQLATALQADQLESAGLKERISAVNAEMAQLRAQMEKLKSEARRQKGLVAIDKKQLSTVEGERDRLQTDLEDVNRSARQISAGPSVSAQVASPTLSASGANNPFVRRTASTDEESAFPLPPAKPSTTDRSFDDIFGPSSPPATSTSTPPPVTLCKPQTTGTSAASAGSFATPPSTTPNASRRLNMPASPPPPPASSQVSPNDLPLVVAAVSLSTSRQPSPPLSRTGHEGSAHALSPAEPVEATPTRQSPAWASASNRTASPAECQTMRNGTSFVPGQAPTSDAAKAAPARTEVNPFAALDSAKAKEAFDSAFASFTSAKPAKPADGSGSLGNPIFSKLDHEFPPSSDFDHAKSDSHEVRGGFDDDFAPASPKTASAAQDEKPVSPIPTQTTFPAVTADGPTEQPVKSESSAPPAIIPTSPALNNIAGPSVNVIFGSRSSKAPSAAPPAQSAAAQAGSKAALNDLDDDFDGLEDAKEGLADDEFTTISRSGLDDFTPVFDRSPQPGRSKSESTATTGHVFSMDGGFDLRSLSSSVTAAGTTQQPALQLAKSSTTVTDSNEWDDLFAGLHDSKTTVTPSLNAFGLNGTAGGIGEKDTWAPSGQRIKAPDSASDDPILKNLTSMGYSRTDALSALEKYDYNLERAANFLASQS